MENGSSRSKPGFWRWGLVGGVILVLAILLRLSMGGGAATEEAMPTEGGPADHTDRAEEVDRVRVEAGELVVGCVEPSEVGCVASEKPARRMTLPSFSIDRTEVTVAAYRACVEAGACSEPDRGGACNYAVAGRERHPINCVEWQQAEAFCAWRGDRLPTQWEWERAARGTQGDRFPWGDAAADCTRAVIDEGSGNACGAGDGTFEVGSKPDGASAEGALDLIGNVWEWTSSTPEHSGSRIVRGGAYYVEPDTFRTSLGIPFTPNGRADYVGFRCAR